MGSASANEMGFYSQTLYNLLRADLCLGELDTHFTWNSPVRNSTNRNGFCYNRQSLQAHAPILLKHSNELCLSCTCLSEVFYLGKQARTLWTWSWSYKYFVHTLSHWLEVEYGRLNFACWPWSHWYQRKNQSGKMFLTLLLKCSP